jgi:hypothetical protein
MRRLLSFPFLVIPVTLAIGCTKPDLDFVKIRVGMAKNEIIARVGNPTRTSVVKDCEIFEYEAYDRYGALIVNRRSQFIRFMNGKVESFGNMEDLNSVKASSIRTEPDKQMSLGKAEESLSAKAAASATTFDLRTELEKLEKLKRDGLISEAEFKELRQRVMEKAKAL